MDGNYIEQQMAAFEERVKQLESAQARADHPILDLVSRVKDLETWQAQTEAVWTDREVS